jgi:hypothetical protein
VKTIKTNLNPYLAIDRHVTKAHRYYAQGGKYPLPVVH